MVKRRSGANENVRGRPSARKGPVCRTDDVPGREFFLDGGPTRFILLLDLRGTFCPPHAALLAHVPSEAWIAVRVFGGQCE